MDPTCTWSATLADAARMVVGLVFVAAGVAKIKAAARLEALIKAVGDVLAIRMPPWLGNILPLGELAMGVVLIAGLGGTLTIAAAVMFLVALTVILQMMVRRGYDGSCACFGGHSGRTAGTLDLVRNAVLCGLLVVAASAGVTCELHQPSLVRPEATVLAAVAFLVLTVFYRLADELDRLLRRPGGRALRRTVLDE